jgi:hypothetical protein
MCEPFEDIFPEQEKFRNSVYLCFQKQTLKAKVEGKEKQIKQSNIKDHFRKLVPAPCRREKKPTLLVCCHIEYWPVKDFNLAKL